MSKFPKEREALSKGEKGLKGRKDKGGESIQVLSRRRECISCQKEEKHGQRGRSERRESLGTNEEKDPKPKQREGASKEISSLVKLRRS